MYYEISGSGTPILLLHGNSQSHHVFHSYAHRLEQSYQVILMDSRGHGHSRCLPDATATAASAASTPSSAMPLAASDHAPDCGTAPSDSNPTPGNPQFFTIHDMACDAAALLDYLGIPKAVLFGFSDGANIALEFACCFPERTLAVISASGNALPHGLRLPVRLGAQAAGCALSLAQKMLPDVPLRKQFTEKIQLNALLTDSPDLSAERLQTIQAPVLLLAGTRDLIKTSHTRWMAEQIPNSRLCLIEGGTHNVLFAREDQCRKLIEQFLLEHSPCLK